MTKRISVILIAAFMMLGMLVGCNVRGDKEGTLDKVESVVFDKHEITLVVGESANINATIEPSELSDAKLTWKSSDESVATVSRGLVTAISEGMAVITAVTDNGKLDSCIVTVTERDEFSDDEDDAHNKDDGTGSNGDNNVVIGSEIGNKCPNFPISLIDSDETVKIRDYIGKKVVINLWGTWCGPCKAELPDLDRIAEDYDGEVIVLTIHSVVGLENASAYINEQFSDSKMIFAYDTALTKFTDMCFNLLGGTDYYPRTLILDENGIIRFAQDGRVSYSQVSDALDSLASDDKPAAPEINLVSYTVRISTVGGMSMSDLPVYIYEYEDGSLGDIIDYAATNANGNASFTLPEGGSYAAKIDISMPEGYDVEDHYPLVSNNLNITVSSAVIPETDLSGVRYELGDIIRDFTVTTTESRKFTLSEALKEKKAVLINFWYDGCSWCELEFPLMQKAYEKYSDDLEIIALDPPHATGGQDNLLSISQYKSALGLTFDVAMDNDGLYSAFGVEGYPTSIIIDRYGVICMIEEGAILSQRAFDCIFEHFTSDNYEQKLVIDYEDIVPEEKPNLDMPSSEDMSDAFDKGTIEGIHYLPYSKNADEDEREKSWPFIISEYDGETVIQPSNSFKEYSFAQLIIEVPLKAGEALACDYFSSTEMGADILYIIVDGVDLYSISGESEAWQSCFVYVAEEDDTYEFAFVYRKNINKNVGVDTVYLKNLRIVSEAEINQPTYIFRYAATNLDNNGNYQDYITPVLGSDGYYHVDSADGPLLLANLMNSTRFSTDDYVCNMCLGKDYEQKLTRYCDYASNSQINGVCPVTPELKELLIRIVEDYGIPTLNDEQEWLKICNYYDSYGTADELSDPIKGLAPFSAYDVVLSEKGDTDYPNSITYDRVIMPRGLFSKFTPAESGTYLITSFAPDTQPGTFIDCEAWIFTEDGFYTMTPWYTYENADRNNVGYDGDMSNVYMIVYLEANVDYYINIAYADVYQNGIISFRVERLGDEGIYRFSLASPSYFMGVCDDAGNIIGTISGGIDLELKDGIWYEKRADGRHGSMLYADFTRPTSIFWRNISELIEAGAFTFITDENDDYVLAIMKSNQAYAFYIELYLKDLWGSEYNAKSAEYKVSEVLSGIYHGAINENGYRTMSENDKYILELRDNMATNTEYNNRDNFKEFLKEYWGDTYQESFEIYKVDEVLEGKYHGSGEDYTAEISKYLDKVIKVGYNAQLGEIIAEGDSRIGCVVVDETLANILQTLMDKYTFEGVENSWAKLCYYEQYFCSATPF